VGEVEVLILGKKIVLTSDADHNYIKEVANFVNERFESAKSKVSSGTAPLMVAILGAMDIADEYFKTRGQRRFLKEELEKRVDNLIKYIEDKVAE